MNEKELYDDNKEVESQTGVQPLSGTSAITPITAGTGLALGAYTPTKQSDQISFLSAGGGSDSDDPEEDAKTEGLLQVNNNVSRVNDNLPKEEFVSTKDLYKKNFRCNSL